MKRLPRPLLILAAGLVLAFGAAGFAAIVAPVPTDAAAGPAGLGLNIAAAECETRVAAAGRGFSTTLANLSNAAEEGPEARCAAYRAHVAALTEARDVYAVCMSGFARDDQVAQIEIAARTWRSAIAVRCGN